MAVSIRQIHPVFVGEVSGVDLRQPLTRDEVAAIEAGMDRYAVLVFRDQNITDEQQIAFTPQFRRDRERRRRQRHQAARTAAQPADERRLQPRQGRQAAGARRPPPAVQSRQPAVAFGQLVPRDPGEIFAAVRRASSSSKGGNTEFADMRAAYDALDDETQARWSRTWSASTR